MDSERKGVGKFPQVFPLGGDKWGDGERGSSKKEGKRSGQELTVAEYTFRARTATAQKKKHTLEPDAESMRTKKTEV